MVRTLSAIPLLATGCASPFASETAAEWRVRSMFESEAYGDGQVVLDTGPLRLMWSGVRHSRVPGPDLRAAAERLARCGQAPDDVLDVRIRVAGGWPWEVRVLESTPGAAPCLQGVLSQLPLDTDLWTGDRYFAARTTLATLRRPRPEEVDPPECTLRHRLDPAASVDAQLPVGEIALAVTCAADAPLTELTLRYIRGALAEVATDPPVPCVEARARAALSAVDALALAHPDGTEAAPVERWDEVSCRLTVPLGVP